MRSGISLRFHQLLHILWDNISNPDARGEEKPSTLNYKNRSFPQTLLWQSLKDHCGARGGEIPRLFHSTPALQDTHLLPSLRQCYLPASLTHWGCSLATSFQRVCQLPGQAFEPARCTDTHTHLHLPVCATAKYPSTSYAPMVTANSYCFIHVITAYRSLTILDIFADMQ